MKKLVFIGVMLVLLASMAVAGGQSDATKVSRIVHFHWTETSYDPINNHAVELFQAKHPAGARNELPHSRGTAMRVGERVVTAFDEW